MNGKLEILSREIESTKSNMKTLELERFVIWNKKHSEYILEYICNIYISYYNPWSNQKILYIYKI